MLLHHFWVCPPHFGSAGFVRNAKVVTMRRLFAALLLLSILNGKATFINLISLQCLVCVVFF